METILSNTAYDLKDILDDIDEPNENAQMDEYTEDNRETSDNANAEDNEHYDIVSTTAYLLGIKRWVFESETEPLKQEIFEKLEKERNAKIMRNLCMLRNLTEHNFMKILLEIRKGNNISNIPDLLPTDTMMELYDAGINIYQELYNPSLFIIHINTLITQRVGNCRGYFPEWINWDYLKDIFIMKDGTTPEGQKRAADFFYSHMDYYPYRQYMNWPAKKLGNILKNDRRFLSLLYEWNGDEFTATNLVSDISSLTKDNIYSFIENSKKCVFIVDCENSDPYSFCAAIKSLDKEKLGKIDNIILYDDINAASAWDMVSSYIDIPVEYVLIERVKENKSLTDVKVITRACKEFYTNNADSFVLVSSDSDYWGLIEELPEANFLVMVEHDKCSPALKGTLLENNIFYCYLDNFYAGGGEEIKQDALHKELAKKIRESFTLNLNELMHDVLKKTRIDMSEEEIRRFISRRIKGQIDVDIDDEGIASLGLRIRK